METRLCKFLKNFNDNQAVNRGLSYFSTKRQHVDRAVEEVLTHTPNVRVVNALVEEFDGLKANGDLLSLYKETVDLYVIPDIHLSQELKNRTAYQDLLNALSFELQGLYSGSGEPSNLSVEQIRDLAKTRLNAAQAFQARLYNSAEFRRMFKAQAKVARELSDCETRDDLKSLGEYLSSRVPQLPLLRRWWAFN